MFETGAEWRSRAGCEGGGQRKDKKGKVEKKQVAQLDDGMCAMACEQMRQIKNSVSKVKSTDEGMEVVRNAMAGVGKQARSEELQRVEELEEGLKKLEEDMRPRTIEEQDVMRDFEEECEEKVTREGRGEICGKDEGREKDRGTKARWADWDDKEDEEMRQGASEGKWQERSRALCGQMAAMRNRKGNRDQR